MAIKETEMNKALLAIVVLCLCGCSDGKTPIILTNPDPKYHPDVKSFNVEATTVYEYRPQADVLCVIIDGFESGGVACVVTH